MADPSAFYEPEEEELLSSLSVPNYNGAGYDGDQEYQAHLQELESHAYAQNGQDQEAEQAAALEGVPKDVKRFLVLFHQAILENDLPAITNMYESGWQKLTQQHYQSSEWPDPELVSVLVQNDQVFLTLYRELYFRHVYAKLQPTIDDRFQSYENICELFNYLLNSEEPVPLDLPIQWLWDMLDEFVYQFQSFAQWRANASNKSEEELDMLTEAQQVWSCYSVLNVLYSLVQKSEINAQLKAEKEGKSAEEVAEIGGAFGSKPLYRNLGYFSTICLLRVHVLLGDPTLALQTMENVELGGGALITRITACHVTTYYHVGCAYMALGRWPDAIKTFVSVLIFFVRMKPYHTRSYQYGSITKQCERMYALLAICTTLSPGPTDESIMSIVKEHYSDQLQTLQRGGPESLEIYKDLFLSSCPKYLSVNPPPYEDPTLLEQYISNPPTDATVRHLELFLSDVEAVRGVSGVRNLLKLYTSIDASKLAAFNSSSGSGSASASGNGEGEGEGLGEKEILEQLMVLKGASRTYSHQTGEGSNTLLDGDRLVTNNLDFTIDASMVHVEETTSHRRYAGYFIRNAEHAQRVYNTIRSSPLPSQRKPVSASASAQQGQEKKETQGGEKKNVWQPKKRVQIAA